MIPTHKLQYLFWAKSILVPPTALAMVIWISACAGGAGEFFHEPASIHGAERAWTWLSTLTAATGQLSLPPFTTTTTPGHALNETQKQAPSPPSPSTSPTSPASAPNPAAKSGSSPSSRSSSSSSASSASSPPAPPRNSTAKPSGPRSPSSQNGRTRRAAEP